MIKEDINPDDDGTHDLHWEKDEICYDVMSHYKGGWSCYFANTRVRENVTTRDEAEQWLKSKTFKELIEIVKELK